MRRVKKIPKFTDEQIKDFIVHNKCPLCKKGSKKMINSIRTGVRHNVHSDIQIFQCKICYKYFSIDIIRLLQLG